MPAPASRSASPEPTTSSCTTRWNAPGGSRRCCGTDAGEPDDEQVRAAAGLLGSARHPLIYAGAGAAGPGRLLVALAQKLRAPVATTIQGKGVFPESHPLWLWNGLGRSTPPFAREIAARADAMLAIGCRFSEVGTASYGFTPPANLVHVDINPEVFNRNFPAAVAIASDAGAFVRALLRSVRASAAPDDPVAEIADGHRRVLDEWRRTPGDSGNGTFLAMEHLRFDEPRCFIGPIDYSCMGYAIPAAIGAKLANPDRDVVAVAGDGALLMTGLELLTASALRTAPLVCVLRDGELGQIAQFQRTSLNRDTCSVLTPYRLDAFAAAVNAAFFRAATDGDVQSALERALQASRAGQPAVVEVAIDYSRKTYFTRGVVATTLGRLPLGDRLRMLGRAAARHVAGAVAGRPRES